MKSRIALTLATLSLAACAQADGIVPGSYECWAFSSPRMGLNFEIDGKGGYTDSEGTHGSYTYDAATKRIVFESGLLEDAMPEGFYSIYEVREGNPTVSFQSARDVEASFCEKAG